MEISRDRGELMRSILAIIKELGRRKTSEVGFDENFTSKQGEAKLDKIDDPFQSFFLLGLQTISSTLTKKESARMKTGCNNSRADKFKKKRRVRQAKQHPTESSWLKKL